MPPKQHFALSNYLMKESQYKITNKVIGSGSYGVVFEGKRTYRPHRQVNEITEDVAVKVLKGDIASQKEQKAFLREIEILVRCKHESLLSITSFSLPNSQGEIRIITPLFKHGNLHNVLDCRRRGLASLPDIENFDGTKKMCNAFGLACGMAYMHQNKIVHRDLKTENVLIDDDFYPKVCDFGFAKILNEDLTRTKDVGSPLYMAPEQIRGEEYFHKVDVYAYGMILYEIYTDEVPFSGEEFAKSEMRLFDAVVNGIRPKMDDSVPPKIQELILSCLHDSPDQRPDFVDIVNLAYGNDFFEIPNENIDYDAYQDYQDKAIEGLELDKHPFQEKIL